MITAREDILSRIRNAIAGQGSATGTVDKRLQAHAVNTIPARGRCDRNACIDAFVTEAEKVDATVARITGADAVPSEVVRYLTDNNLPSVLRLAPDPRVAVIPWAQQTLLEVSTGAARSSDTASVSHAFAAVAETGTVVMVSGAENPTTLNYLPPTHFAIIAVADIFGSYEEVWRRLRAQRAGVAEPCDVMPRAVNWITGPSRTADIEQTILLGAHGPQRLHIVIVDGKKN